MSEENRDTPDIDDLIQDKGTWSLDPEALQNIANAVVAAIIRQATELFDTIEVSVGDEKVGVLHVTTRYGLTEVEAMIDEVRKP